MRIMSTLFKVLATVAATILAIYLLANGAVVAGGLVKRHQVADEVTESLVRILPSAERAQAELVDTVGREPERRWIEQRCEFRSVDSGWIAVDHREVCVLRTVTAWRVGSEREARDLGDLHDLHDQGTAGLRRVPAAGRTRRARSGRGAGGDVRRPVRLRRRAVVHLRPRHVARVQVARG